MPSLGGVCALVGFELEPLFDCEVVWRQDRIVSIQGRREGRLQDVERVLIPSFINAHTHIGDSAAKEAYVGLTLQEAVDPHTGIKTRILSNTPREELVEAMRATIREAAACGVTHLVDFREGGLEGLELAKRAASGTGVDVVLLGRLSKPPSKERVLGDDRLTDAELEELYRVAEAAHGIGVSGANEYGDRMLEQIREVARTQGKILAAHCLESQETRSRLTHVLGRDEFERCHTLLRPDIYVHMTAATPEEVRAASATGKIVSCPRSNAALANGTPPLDRILESGGALGTDNAMINSPDMFREMEFAYKTLVCAARRPYRDVKLVLKAATTNMRPLLGLGPLEVGAKADFVLLEVERSWNLYSTIVNRAGKHSVKLVVKDGETIHTSN